jgi:hypothetical protein
MNWNLRKPKKEMTEARRRARIRAYVKEGGTTCPYCGNNSLVRVQGDTWGQEPERVSVRVDCINWGCKRHWYDVYTLTDLVEAAL